ncbi:zinc finger protein 37 homolog isoform X1 [Synchiropus splendidus]|uniref:zinc finger protein 37 homolog isoform X1 n=1 Tax=Synchiropus splendidus TaxID=270530 RepID=UPI00237DDB7E|nr:zinc finger protein 37 homolog isoform X1 [Synchiropus splendidus]
MSSERLLKAFVTERLTAAAEEIADFFGKTIAKYEEEACESQREITRLRSLLMDLASYRKSEEATPEQNQRELEASPCHVTDVELLHIKKESRAAWGSQQVETQTRESKDNDALFVPHTSTWSQNGEVDVKPFLNSPENGSEGELQCQEPLDIQGVHPALSAPSMLSPQSPNHSEATENLTEHLRTSTCLEHNSAQPHNPGETSYNCYVCDVSFSYKQHLVNHALRVHSPETGVVCAVCGDALDSTESLRLHLETHRLPKSCHICGKQCKSTSTMTGHIASHTGEKPHRCHFCGKECRRKGDLKIHMRIHTGEKPFSCSYCCKSFTHSGHLTKHMRNHTGERPHQCSVCGKGFLQSAHLKYHLKTHAEKS